MTAEVVVIGDALLDVSARPSAPIPPGADAPAEVRIGFGGQGANLAVRLARSGVGVELVCALGDDPAGSLLADALRAEGVQVEPVRVAATGAVVIFIDEVGERTMLSQRAPFVQLLGGRRLSASGAGWLVLSGYLFLEPAAAALAGMIAALPVRRAVVGCSVPSPSIAAWRRAAAAAQPDLLILNRAEAAALAPADQLSGGIVVTAADRVTASIGAASASIRVPPSPPAADSTGAGDAFAAALVAALLHGAWPPSAATLESALAGAAHLGSQVAGARGAQARVAAERQ